MAKRLFLFGLLAAAVACKSGTTDKDRTSRMSAEGQAAASDLARDPVELALAALDIDGRILRIDLNQANWEGGPVHIGKAHLLGEHLLLESGPIEPDDDESWQAWLYALQREGLTPRWRSDMVEPSLFGVSESPEMALIVTQHYLYAFEKRTGRRGMQFVSGALAGLRRPPMRLPFSPTGGAAGTSDTVYLPSLGSPDSNKNLEAFSLVTGSRGWGYRAPGEIRLDPVVAGATGDPKLYFVTSQGIVTCLDATNYGRMPEDERWQVMLDAPCDQPYFVTEDTDAQVGAVFVVDVDGVVYALNRITGERRWVNPTGRKPAGGPEVFGDLCIVRMQDGLIAYDANNVLYRVRVESGPDAGSTWLVRSDRPYVLGSGGDADFQVGDRAIADQQLNFELQGEVLYVTGMEGSTFMVDLDERSERVPVVNGSRIKVGRSTFVVEDRGSEPLWTGLDFDRVVTRVGDRLVVASGNRVAVVHAMTGEVLAGPVELPGGRLMPRNTKDANLFVVAGDAVVYALYPR